MQTDEALARSIQKGNASDMTELANRYYDPLLRYLYRMCGGNQALAEDMSQETFLRMMRGITAYDSTRPFKPWFYSIARNIVRNHFSRADTRYADNPGEDSDFTDDNPLPEEAVMHHENARQVFDALMQLPELYRSVVVLFYYEELPQKEIASILEIPVGTVKSRLSNGLKRLRAMMSNEVKEVQYE